MIAEQWHLSDIYVYWPEPVLPLRQAVRVEEAAAGTDWTNDPAHSPLQALYAEYGLSPSRDAWPDAYPFAQTPVPCAQREHAAELGLRVLSALLAAQFRPLPSYAGLLYGHETTEASFYLTPTLLLKKEARLQGVLPFAVGGVGSAAFPAALQWADTLSPDKPGHPWLVVTADRVSAPQPRVRFDAYPSGDAACACALTPEGMGEADTYRNDVCSVAQEPEDGDYGAAKTSGADGGAAPLRLSNDARTTPDDAKNGTPTGVLAPGEAGSFAPASPGIPLAEYPPIANRLEAASSSASASVSAAPLSLASSGWTVLDVESAQWSTGGFTPYGENKTPEAFYRRRETRLLRMTRAVTERLLRRHALAWGDIALVIPQTLSGRFLDAVAAMTGGACPLYRRTRLAECNLLVSDCLISLREAAEMGAMQPSDRILLIHAGPLEALGLTLLQQR